MSLPKLFSRHYYNTYSGDADHKDRRYYSAKLKLRKFDSLEFQSINPLPPEPPEITPCVEINNLSFHYNVANPILKDVTMTVPKGKIYALLGASGCGKTTLLRMILGTYKPMSGTIRVFGQEPGSHGSSIPGPGVGYMPQDLALFKLLSISEILTYYGSLYGIPKSMIKESVKNFIELLNLPDKNRMVGQLSGGQQRRVSLAVTMIHRPPLLILDEPTVGVDSLLRQKIWNYLEELCAKYQTTVIITTHYTEEARNSFRVGFIDSGTMLAEDNPKRLMHKYDCNSLEDVFLELCLEKGELEEQKNQEKEKGNRSSLSSSLKRPQVQLQQQQQQHPSIPTIIMEESENTDGNKTIEIIVSNGDLNNNENNGKVPTIKEQKLVSSPQPPPPPRVYDNKMKNYNNKRVIYNKKINHFEVPCEKYHNDSFINMGRLRALLTKNYILFKRNPNSVILMNVLPILQISLFCLTFARNPHDIPLAVVNGEQNKSVSLANLFLEKIDNQSLDLKYYDNLDQALNAIDLNEARMAMKFSTNFTKYFRKRFLKPDQINDKIIEHSKIGLYTDTSHAVFYLYAYQKILDAFESFIQIVGSMMGYNPRFFGSPIDVQEPIYGKMKIRYFEFITPGMLIAIVHGLPLLIGSFSVVRERADGHLERGFVAGIKTGELLLSYIIFYILPVLSQVVFLVFLTFYIFESTCVGSLWEVFLMLFTSGLQGVSIGIVLSIICPSELASLMLSFCVEMPLIFTSGVLWPIESLPGIARHLVLLNPMTLPIRSNQWIMYRGWSLLNFEVLFGFLASISYTCIILVCGLIFFQVFK